jgi:nucleoid-associated protein YgaU
LDKATYAPGEKMTLTVTVKDAASNLVADSGTTCYTVLGTTGLVASTSTTGTLPTGALVCTVNGVSTYTVYAPLVGGPLSINGTSALTGTPALTVAATVTVGTTGISAADSAATATAAATAAKASADAATAAVAALSTTVASLIASAQIRALSAQIAKLMAKAGGTTPGLPKTGSKK